MSTVQLMRYSDVTMGLKIRLIIYTLLLFTLTGCSVEPEFDSVYQQIEAPTLSVGSAVPKPKQDVILTVSGKVGNPNDTQTIVMDIPTIEAIGLVEYPAEDPFEEKENTFTGVLMRDLLDLWQVSEDATTLTVLALNDYAVDVPIDLMRDYPVMFAMQQNGEYMQPNYRGPAMLVFPTAHYQSLKQTSNNPYWAWQIKTIVVK